MDELQEVSKVFTIGGKQYYHVRALLTPDEVESIKPTYEDHPVKARSCFGCAFNSIGCDLKQDQAKHECSQTPAYIFISPYSYKRYIAIRIANRIISSSNQGVSP